MSEVTTQARAIATKSAQTGLHRWLRGWLARHTAFLVLLSGAAALRVVVMLGYRPVMWFTDSYDYVAVALFPHPDPVRPSGYPIFLRLLLPLHDVALVAAAQHLMGLLIGVMCYALPRRLGAPAWAAALAAVPVLFDAYQVQLEHILMSDTLFTFLVVLTVVLVRRHPPSVMAVGAAGALLGAAAVVRSVGLPLLVVLTGCLLIQRAGWRALTAAVVAGVAPVAAYLTWAHAVDGRYALSDSGGVFRYSRTMAFADCAKMRPPAQLRPLCDPRPPDARPLSQMYIWDRSSPLYNLGPNPFTPEVNRRAREFANRAIRAQPLDYLAVIAHDTLRAFRWDRTPFPDTRTYAQYQFDQETEQPPSWAPQYLDLYDPGWPTAIMEPYATALNGYQRYVFLRGTMLGGIFLIGAATLIAKRSGAHGRVPGLLPWAFAVALIVAPAATAEFSYRYVLAAVPLACVAAGLAAARDPADADRSSDSFKVHAVDRT